MLINENTNWNEISREPLSESFIEKFQDKVDWDKISCSQKLSESFIIKHIDKLNLDLILQYQKLSIEWIEKLEGMRNGN